MICTVSTEIHNFKTNSDFFPDHCFSKLLEHWIQLSFFEASVPLFGGIPQNLADFAPLAEAIFYLLIKKKSESPIAELDLFMQQVKLKHCEKATKLKKKSPSCFDVYLVNQQICQKKWEIFSNFCGLFRKAEL